MTLFPLFPEQKRKDQLIKQGKENKRKEIEKEVSLNFLLSYILIKNIKIIPKKRKNNCL